MRFDLLTIFPGFFTGPLEHGMVRRALRNNTIQVVPHDLRAWTSDRHRTVDDRPFGGGEGMLLKPEPIARCLASLDIGHRENRDPSRETVLLLSAQGRPFTQAVARELAGFERVVMICGRYEGVDERINQRFCDREISIGDYILTGGELPALVILDAVVRLLPGVLGNPDSAHFESFGAQDDGGSWTPGAVPPSTHGAGGLLDYPQYTRPAEWEGMAVPEVLQEGNHVAIRRWRREQALLKTARNRPELLESATLTEADRSFLARIRRENA